MHNQQRSARSLQKRAYSYSIIPERSWFACLLNFDEKEAGTIERILSLPPGLDAPEKLFCALAIYVAAHETISLWLEPFNHAAERKSE